MCENLLSKFSFITYSLFYTTVILVLQAKRVGRRKSVGILDVYGFEVFEVTKRASVEQFLYIKNMKPSLYRRDTIAKVSKNIEQRKGEKSASLNRKVESISGIVNSVLFASMNYSAYVLKELNSV